MPIINERFEMEVAGFGDALENPSKEVPANTQVPSPEVPENVQRAMKYLDNAIKFIREEYGLAVTTTINLSTIPQEPKEG